jgi:AcrR family transcriptional regulator
MSAFGSHAKSTIRDDIVAEAARQFNEQGYFDTRLEDIAEQISTSKTNISYHFRSKEALLKEVYTISCDFADAEIARAARGHSGLERALLLVRGHAAAHIAALTNNDLPPPALLVDFAGLADDEQAPLVRRLAQQQERFRDFLTEGVADGSIATASPDASTFFIFSVLHWLPRWLSYIPANRRTAAVDVLCDILTYGIAKDRTRRPIRPIMPMRFETHPDIFDRDARNRMKREAILRSGTRFLNRRGVRSLSLNDISAALGVTRGSFYYHIEDKDALVAQCFSRTCDLIETAQRRADEDRGAPPLIRLERAMRHLFEGHITDLDPLLRLNLVHALPPAVRALHDARLRRLSATFAEWLGQAMADGSARPLAIEASEILVLQSVFAASRKRFSITTLQSNWSPVDSPTSASADFFETLFVGLAAPK